ncbi:hypothetical protein IMM1_18560 [Pseudocoprococcus immobilis]
MSDNLYSLFVKKNEYTTLPLYRSHFFVKPYKKQNKNKRKIRLIPIQKIIVSVPAQNDITPKYIVHTKNKTNITI